MFASRGHAGQTRRENCPTWATDRLTCPRPSPAEQRDVPPTWGRRVGASITEDFCRRRRQVSRYFAGKAVPTLQEGNSRTKWENPLALLRHWGRFLREFFRRKCLFSGSSPLEKHRFFYPKKPKSRKPMLQDFRSGKSRTKWENRMARFRHLAIFREKKDGLRFDVNSAQIKTYEYTPLDSNQ